MPNDIILFSSFKKGETLAENVVFKRFFIPLCIYSEKITEHLEQTEDIVAEAMEKGWDRRQEFQALENLKGFLYRAVRNASINYTISVKSHEAAHQHIRYLTKGDEESNDVYQNEIFRAELLTEIYREIDNLPDKCGQIFKMIFIQGLSTEQIAGSLSINVQTVRTQKARALQLIKTELFKKKKLIAWLLLLSILYR